MPGCKNPNVRRCSSQASGMLRSNSESFKPLGCDRGRRCAETAARGTDAGVFLRLARCGLQLCRHGRAGAEAHAPPTAPACGHIPHGENADLDAVSGARRCPSAVDTGRGAPWKAICWRFGIAPGDGSSALAVRHQCDRTQAKRHAGTTVMPSCIGR